MSARQLVWLLSLFAISFYWPSEQAYDGTGLPWVLLWCLLSAAVALTQLFIDRPASSNLSESERSAQSSLLNTRSELRWNTADTGWCLIAAGQWISTGVVFSRGGDFRSALNLSFEWLGILIFMWLTRNSFRHPEFRRQATSLLMAMGVGLAVFGIWQHHVHHRQLAEWYQSLRADQERLKDSGDHASVLRRAAVQRELQEAGIPLEGPERFLWEQRLLNSSEPTGTFALANSLAGILALCLMILAASVVRIYVSGPRTGPLAVTMLLFCAVAICYCLVLTKSRTAWVGCMAGTTWLFLSRFRSLSSAFASPMFRRTAGGGIAIACVTVAIAASAGALDREVILESPRSLQFRLLYWMGTAGILQEQPLFGTGPGNFRQSWLQHKWPESSEEIRDPHNWILEAWTSGGLISLAGALLLVGVLFRSVLSGSDAAREQPAAGISRVSPPGTRRRSGRGFLWLSSAPLKALFCSLILYGSWQWLNGGSLEMTDLSDFILPTTALVVLILRLDRFLDLDQTASQAAALALTIHLMGAGGFQMPATMLCLVTVFTGLVMSDRSARPEIVCSNGNAEPDTSPLQNPLPDSLLTVSPEWSFMQRFRLVCVALFCLTGAAVSCWYGVIPVTRVQTLIARGHQQQANGELRPAAATFRTAAAVDGHSVPPRQRLAILETYRLVNAAEPAGSVPNLGATQTPNSERVNEMIVSAMEACESWLTADPRNPAVYRTRASARMAAGQLLGDTAMKELAIEDQQRVVKMYPGNAADWYRLAEMQTGLASNSDANSEEFEKKYRAAAQEAASKALRQEEINRSWGHADRFLTTDQVNTLKSLVPDR